MLRPRPCNWFELITSRDDLAAVLAALADTGAVELQTHERRGAPLVVGGAAMRALERFHELARIHRGRWPAARTDGAPRIESVHGTRLVLTRVTVRTPDAARAHADLLAAGVLVRRQDGLPGLAGCLRVTIGSPAENDAFLAAAGLAGTRG